MAHRYHRLPSLTSLTAFEAASRHRSFKRAAEELNVTPGAISRQVKSLEDEIGVALFVRAQTGLVLTAEAEALYAVLSHAFSRAAETVASIRSGNRAQRVTLACTNAFATRWLMPRMGDFWRRYPEITVDHLISDDARDFRRTEVDLRIRYGSGAWPDETSTLLLNETIYPISAPGYAREHADATAAEIPELSLLHVDWVDADWTGWDELLRRASIPHGPLPGRRFSSFAITLQACIEEQGLAVGWHRLVSDLVASGQIAPFTDLRIASPGSYHLTWNANRAVSEPTRILKAWLFDMASRDTG
jgi:LysR family transcriptional regulator, glycine cleavage system transcriptional activator